MVVVCVQHYSTHFIKKLGKSLESFFHKVQKTAKKGKKWPKMANNDHKLRFYQNQQILGEKGALW